MPDTNNKLIKEIHIIQETDAGALLTAASVDESIAGGNIRPIDFKTLEITYQRDSYGLEDFYEMVKYLDEVYPELKISMTLAHLPLGRKFSWLPDGRRRVCAVVLVKQNGKKPVFILEIARPDHRPLSTLIVQFHDGKDRDDEERSIHQLLHGLASENQSCKIEAYKQFSQSLGRESIRSVNLKRQLKGHIVE